MSLCQAVHAQELSPKRARGEGFAFDMNLPTNVTIEAPLEGKEKLPVVPFNTGSGYEYVHGDEAYKAEDELLT